MRFELFDYQEAAKTSVVRALLGMTRAYGSDSSEQGAVVLAAPTGAGKTVIATAVIEAALDGDETIPEIEDSTFLWVTDDPSLNKQTLHKMVAASSALGPNRLVTIENDFDQELLDSGRVYFLNIQKLASSATLSKRAVDGRTYSLWDTIENTIKQRPHGFVVVVDEAHRGMGTAKSTRDTIVSQIIGGATTTRPAAPIVWGISATPKRFRDQMDERGRTVKVHSIPIEDVRASGLLKDQIVLGHTKGIEAAESTLVRHAVEKIRDCEARWADYCQSNGDPRVDPILVVQVGDKPTAKELGDLVATVLEEWPAVAAANIIHTFASHSPEKAGKYEIAYCPPEDIQDRQDVRVVLCKTAITTGWDCPRAEVLVSMRVARDAELITQIIGRMVRTPLARRILTDQTLNTVHCILPKFDETAVDDIAEQFQQGDEGLAGGTEIITQPVQLSRNPTFSSLSPETPRLPTQSQDSATSQHPDEDLSWFGPEEHADQGESSVNRTDSKPSPRLKPLQDSPTLQEATDAPTHQVIPSSGQEIYELIEGLPSYTIPRRTRRPGVSRLIVLATLLAEKHDGNSIEPAAQMMAKNALLAEIDTFKANLVAKGELDGKLENVANTRLYERAVTYGPAADGMATVTTDSLLELDSRGIEMLMSKARRQLPEGLATAYVNRLSVTDAEVTDAQITTIALAQDPELPILIEKRASHLVADWLQTYSSAITRLSAADQEKFDRVRRESDRPLPTAFTIPTSRTEDDNGEIWERHVLSDVDGKFRETFRKGERYVLTEELKHGAVAWYRNPSSGGPHALQIPWVGTDGIHGLSPDFIFIHRVGGKLRASLIDPHGAFLSDAVPKLKGLVEYTEQHGDDFHRIQSIDEVDGRYRMLNLKDSAIRAAITAFNESDASELFRSHGSQY